MPVDSLQKHAGRDRRAGSRKAARHDDSRPDCVKNAETAGKLTAVNAALPAAASYLDR
jgi:hypothetical protein